MLSQLEKTYKGKRIFLTGHTGFKGAWLLKILSLIGAEVRGYALSPNTDKDLYHLINGDNLCDSVIADIRNRDQLTESVTEFDPHFIFHLAAQPLVRLSYEVPSETFEVNAIGTANLLDSVRLLKNPCSVVLITTDKVYHNNEWEYPYRENDRLGGYDPYSASKACTELVIDSYKNSFFNGNNFDIHRKSIAVGRAGNVIGGGDWSNDRLIPDIARALIGNKEVVLRNPQSVRPWQHVLEPIVAYLRLGELMEIDPIRFGSVFNFGPYSSDAISVEDMLKLAINCWGSGEFRVEQLENQPHEAGLLKLDISKAIKELNWKPVLNAKQAIRMTVDWYKEFTLNSLDIDSFTTKQIMAYLNA
ncbi:CDP-glucose 4,6-dehydratase [Pedobacter duraquae]|uniref:CDP-glucose 4,6-dehydratase n=1 Tax=Pedobacter duraquae TaxID=425511 RepID=A0A4R6IIZ3_9SPHI|nr:CDP-glucose 4,6-dehydratase [Pedobacter duraquae]TDO21964.1 CDP-glucose 4,6-dehydratase [Pedobacter duraquae]